MWQNARERRNCCVHIFIEKTPARLFIVVYFALIFVPLETHYVHYWFKSIQIKVKKTREIVQSYVRYGVNANFTVLLYTERLDYSIAIFI